MFYLYLKTHNTTGLNYLGQTRCNPFVYRGSGLHWMRHIKKHGHDVTTIVLYETEFEEEIKEQGLYYSDLWNIVESNDFANLVVESGNIIIHSVESKIKIGRTNKGKKFSREIREKMSISKKLLYSNTEHHSKGKTLSDEAKKKMSESRKGENNGMYGKKHSDEAKKKISEKRLGVITKGFTGKTHTQESRNKTSNTLKGRKFKKTTCPHCGKTGGAGAMKRYHFDNCKIITKSEFQVCIP